MKKLMFLSVFLSLSASVLAHPLVYDFKASVKHMYLKERKISSVEKSKSVYSKYLKASAIKGYLIVDMDGVTSKRVNKDSTAQCLDVGRKRAFLVVMNAGAEKDVRAPKCLPAILDAKLFDTKFPTGSTSGLAEGNLFVGGDSIAAIRPQIDDLNGTLTVGSKLPLPAAGKPGGVAYADYAWQSIYLFGKFNGPNWKGPFPGFEQAWDKNLPETLRRGEEASSVSSYHDLWLCGSGAGKSEVVTSKDDSATLGFPIRERVLKSLAGNLSGAFYLCADNGIDADSFSSPEVAYSFFDQTENEGYDWSRWDDLFVAKRIVKGADKTWDLDAWQNDIWLSGAVDQTTTDVCSGTWTIKLNKKFLSNDVIGSFVKSLGETDEIRERKIRELKEALNPQLVKCVEHQEVVKGGDELLYTILVAGQKIGKTANLPDGMEIHSASVEDKLFMGPMLTPKFCTYYGLNNFK